jgi:hypothetical protein
MKSIIALTLNPAIDGASDAPSVGPTHKIRTIKDRYNPGEGGMSLGVWAEKRARSTLLAARLAALSIVCSTATRLPKHASISRAIRGSA